MSANAAITVTGLDESSPLDDIARLAALPNAELGFLLTFSPEGRNRYPSMDWLERALPIAAKAGRAALHVCGSTARSKIISGELDLLTRHVVRIQINGKVGQPHLDPVLIRQICRAYPNHEIITQHCAGNESLLGVDEPNHAFLVDASGGRGVAPASWNRPATGARVGFAGGLGPQTLAAQLDVISQVAGQEPFWVDMEGAIRSGEDWFDMGRATECVRIFNAWQSHRV